MTCCRAVAAGLFSARATPLRVHLSATRHGGLQGRRVPCVVCGALAKEAPYIKVCGVMSAADAQHAAEAGANLIGMIMFPRAKRALTVEQAKRVAEVARAHGAEPVGVFVDEDAETIVRCADAPGRQVEDLWSLRVLHSQSVGALDLAGCGSTTTYNPLHSCLFQDSTGGGSQDCAAAWSRLASLAGEHPCRRRRRVCRDHHPGWLSLNVHSRPSPEVRGSW